MIAHVKDVTQIQIKIFEKLFLTILAIVINMPNMLAESVRLCCTNKKKK